MAAPATRPPHDNRRPAPFEAAVAPDEILAPALAADVEARVRGEIDVQITTARRYPRSIEQFKQTALSLATADEETAASCFYVLPKRKGSDKPIEGPSARLAEIIASTWGHLRIKGELVDEGDRAVTVRGTAWDLQTNVAKQIETRRRIVDREGGRYSEDLIAVTTNAAISITTRNVVFQVIPQSYWRPVYLKCREVAVGTAETLASRRAKMIEYFGKMGVSPARLFAALDIRGLDDITLEHIATLKGIATAIKEGDTSIDETFPEVGPTRQAVDPRAAIMAETGATDAQATIVLEAFRALDLAPSVRTVQLKAHKGNAAGLLALLRKMAPDVVARLEMPGPEMPSTTPADQDQAPPVSPPETSEPPSRGSSPTQTGDAAAPPAGPPAKRSRFSF